MKAPRSILLAVQLLVALPLLWWGLFPRLGPPEWATFILLAGMLSSYAAPLLAAGNAAWLVLRRRSAEGRGRVDVPVLLVALLWASIAVLSWTGIAITPLRSQFAEAPTQVATALQCMPTRVAWSVRGAEVDCRKTMRSGEREVRPVIASNGPFPWSPWRIVAAPDE